MSQAELLALIGQGMGVGIVLGVVGWLKSFVSDDRFVPIITLLVAFCWQVLVRTTIMYFAGAGIDWIGVILLAIVWGVLTALSASGGYSWAQLKGNPPSGHQS